MTVKIMETAAETAGKEDSSMQRTPQQMVMDEDPLLIAQTLTYVTDDNSVILSFKSAPASWGKFFCEMWYIFNVMMLPKIQNSSFYFTGFKLRFILLEVIFVLLVVVAVPIGAHGTVVSVSIGNLFAVAWFWYNLIRSVDITSDGGLRFWIGNIEIDVPFDKIVSMRRVALTNPCTVISLKPHRGFLSQPTDGVCIVTTVPSTPFWLWPRSAGKPDRTCCWGRCACPRLTVVFSPSGGSLNFIREVENEMRNFTGTKPATPSSQDNNSGPPVGVVRPGGQDFLDV